MSDEKVGGEKTGLHDIGNVPSVASGEHGLHVSEKGGKFLRHNSMFRDIY